MKNKIAYFAAVTVLSTSLLLASEKIEFNYLSEVIAGNIERNDSISQKTLQHFVNLTESLSLKKKDYGNDDLEELKEEFLKNNDKKYINSLFRTLEKVDGEEKIKAFALRHVISHLSNNKEDIF